MNRSLILATAAMLLHGAFQSAPAANWNWANTSGNWNFGASWQGGVIPPANDLTSSLTFGGNVGAPALPTTYEAINDFPGAFFLNQLILNGTDAAPGTSGLSHTISGGTLRFAGTNPVVSMNGSASFAINAPVALGADLVVGGNGLGTVTFNATLTGFADITKQGTSTMRFGTLPVFPSTAAPSENTWMGRLLIESGTVRFNNNAQSGATALRSNPVVFNGPGVLTIKRDNGDQNSNFDTSLRFGAVSGANGSIIATVEGANTSNYDIVITTLASGDFGGSITLPAPTGTGNDGGALTVRGSGTQRLTGTLDLYKDVVVGDGATLTLAGNASLSGQVRGAITFAGGNLVLDNTNGNFTNGRLRDGSGSSTTVESIGGGTLTLIGNALSGTTELTGRLQLGSLSGGGLNKPRSGHLDLVLVHNAGNLASTDLTFQSYSRAQQTIPQLSTVDFIATNGSGTKIALGQSGANPHVRLTTGAFTVPLINNLLSTTAGSISVGWATVNGTDFASYGTNGVVAASTTNWTTTLPASANALITSSVTTPSSEFPYTVNSIKIAPINVGQQLNILGTGHLNTTAFLLTGGIDFLIRSTGGGGISGTGPRFFNVQSAMLRVDAALTAASQPVVKTGDGILFLNNANNSTLTAPTAINQGTLRAAAGTSLPGGEIRFRGGVLELTGGGTFSRNINYGTGSLNWSGIEFDPLANGGLGGEVDVDEDRGSGGFAAFGADVTVDLNLPGSTNIVWESRGFIRSNYALVFGSPTATHRVTFVDSLDLTATELNSADINYNAREIRVIDNPATTGDWARISGTISGSVQNDLLKTGNGTLELSGTNTHLGATIIQQGSLLVTGSSTTSFIHQVKSGATLGGNGSVGAVRVEAGGTLSPGMPVGLASILRTADLTFLDGTSKLSIGIGGTNAGGETLNAYDQLIITGAIALNGADLDLSILGSFIPGASDIFFILLNDGVDPVTGQFAEGTQVTAGTYTFNIFYGANYDTFSLTGGNDIALQIVPEPSSLILLGLGALAATHRRRA